MDKNSNQRKLVNGQNWLMDKKWTKFDKNLTKNKKTKSG